MINIAIYISIHILHTKTDFSVFLNIQEYNVNDATLRILVFHKLHLLGISERMILLEEYLIHSVRIAWNVQHTKWFQIDLPPKVDKM